MQNRRDYYDETISGRSLKLGVSMGREGEDLYLQLDNGQAIWFSSAEFSKLKRAVDGLNLHWADKPTK